MFHVDFGRATPDICCYTYKHNYMWTPLYGKIGTNFSSTYYDIIFTSICGELFCSSLLGMDTWIDRIIID